jgi:hypothetical protein
MAIAVSCGSTASQADERDVRIEHGGLPSPHRPAKVSSLMDDALLAGLNRIAEPLCKRCGVHRLGFAFAGNRPCPRRSTLVPSSACASRISAGSATGSSARSRRLTALPSARCQGALIGRGRSMIALDHLRPARRCSCNLKDVLKVFDGLLEALCPNNFVRAKVAPQVLGQAESKHFLVVSDSAVPRKSPLATLHDFATLVAMGPGEYCTLTRRCHEPRRGSTSC